MGLKRFVKDNDRINVDNFIKDIKDMLDFIKPIKNKIYDIIQEYNNRTPGCSWNKKYHKFEIRFISFGRAPSSLENYLFKMLDDYLKENSDSWKKQFSFREGFHYNESYVYTDREICILVSKILIRLQAGEDLDAVINRELDILFEIKSPMIKRYKQVIIQNLVLEDDLSLEFDEMELMVQGREEKWHEGEVAKSCVIKDFPLKFQIRLRRITPEEFDNYSRSRGLLADQMNISTCLEIIYDFPNDKFSQMLSELSFKEHLASRSVRQYLDQIIFKMMIALKFSTGAYVYPVSSLSIPFNYYAREFFSEGFPIRHKNWMFSFFTVKCIISSKQYQIVQEIFKLLTKCENYPMVLQILNIVERGDAALQYGFNLISLIMYWIIMETVFSAYSKKIIAEQAGWLYGSQETYEERKFWELVYDIRNDYMHGRLWDKINQKIKDNFPDKNVKWFILVAREKTMRILLYLLLLRESSSSPENLFQTPQTFSYRPHIPRSSWKDFRKWIQVGDINELGNPEKYKIRQGLQIISM